MLFLFFYSLSIIIISVVESYPFTSSQKHGRCAGRFNTSNNVIVISLISFTGPAINYHMSVQSFRECHNVCAGDWRCCHFSYHISKEESHPDHAHCFLYSAEECDLASLVSDQPSLWRTGRTGRCQLQTFYPKRRRLFGSEFVG